LRLRAIAARIVFSFSAANLRLSSSATCCIKIDQRRAAVILQKGIGTIGARVTLAAGTPVRHSAVR
jgi:hypothetical protein